MLPTITMLQRWAQMGRLAPASAGLITCLLNQLQPQSRALATHGIADTDVKPAGLSRFYKSVGIKEALEQGGYQILLDARVLKTPGKRPLTLPNRTLALAVAAEWEAQAKRIQPFTMPLMSLAATALDQPRPRTAVIDSLLQYLHTDPVVCRAEPGPLAALQAEALDPLLEWVSGEVGVELSASDSIFGADLSAAQLEHMRKYLLGLSAWHFTAAEQMAAACKSVVMGLALLKRRLTLDQGLAAARLEEDYQIAEWGLVEGGHDVDIADLRVRLAAPHIFVRLLDDPVM